MGKLAHSQGLKPKGNRRGTVIKATLINATVIKATNATVITAMLINATVTATVETRAT